MTEVSVCLIELAAMLPVTEVSVCLIELAAMLPVTEVTLPRRPNFQPAPPLCLSETMKILTLQYSVVRFARQAILHRSREAWGNADV